MSTDPHHEQLLVRLDRAIEVLEEIRDARQAKTFAELKQSVLDRPRGCTLGDQFNDLIQRHDKLEISDARFYEILAEITGIGLPGVVEVTTVADAEPVFICVPESGETESASENNGT